MFAKISAFFKDHTPATLEWLAVVLLHAATIPTLLAGMSGLTDKMPPVDIVLFIWVALIVLFARARMLGDQTIMSTIGLGFFVQAVMMALLFFR